MINRPVVSLLGTRVGGTSAKVITKSIYLELLATTTRERYFRKERNLGSNGRDTKGLPETSTPGLISAMRPDLPQPTHRLIPKDTFGVIFFLRPNVSHHCPEDSVLRSGNDALLRAETELFSTTRDHKLKFEDLERLSVVKDLQWSPGVEKGLCTCWNSPLPAHDRLHETW